MTTYAKAAPVEMVDGKNLLGPLFEALGFDAGSVLEAHLYPHAVHVKHALVSDDGHKYLINLFDDEVRGKGGDLAAETTVIPIRW